MVDNNLLQALIALICGVVREGYLGWGWEDCFANVLMVFTEGKQPGHCMLHL
jgi:hypothetical protein